MNLVVPYFLWIINTVVTYWDCCTRVNTPIFTKHYISLQNFSLLIKVLSSPAWPNWYKSGINYCFWTTISSRFAKWLSYGQSSHRCSLIRIALNLSSPLNMGSFLNTVLKLYIYKYSDVRGNRKEEGTEGGFTPPLEDVMAEAGLQEVETFISCF